MDIDPKTDLTFTRHLALPVSVAWTCWTSPEHIKNFFIPKPHKVTDCNIDLRAGGAFNTVFDIDGHQVKNQGIFLEVIPSKKLVFTDAYSAGWKPAAEPFMTAIVEFEDDGKEGTIYTATARHRNQEARQQHEDMGFFDGWGTVADQLVDYAKHL